MTSQTIDKETLSVSVDERRRDDGRENLELPVKRFAQPDDVTCGPTCLGKVYRYYGLDIPVEQIAGETERNEDGGTLAVFLAAAAMRRGFGARIFVYNLRIFDPSWASLSMEALAFKLEQRYAYLTDPKAKRATLAYLEFLAEGGEIRFEELTPKLLKRILNRNHPILTGLSATHLYQMPRERHDPITNALLDDDIEGEPTGHFLVVSGYEHWGRRFILLDPSSEVPGGEDGRVVVDAQRLTNSILLGVLTYDAVLLELWPELPFSPPGEMELEDVDELPMS